MNQPVNELENKAVQAQMLQDEMDQKEQFNRNIAQIKKQLKQNYSLNQVCTQHALALVELQYLKDQASDRDKAIRALYTQIAGMKIELGQELSPEEQALVDAREAQVAKEEVKDEEPKAQV